MNPWRKKLRQLRDVVSIDDLAKDMGVETLDAFAERFRKGSQLFDDVYRAVRAQGESEADAEATAESAEAVELRGAVREYAAAVLRAASRLYARHELWLAPKGSGVRDYKVVPQTSWERAADKIRGTMNGVGLFHFGTLSDFLASGPYTPRQAVLGHLRTITDWPTVYEGRRASRMVEEEMRR